LSYVVLYIICNKFHMCMCFFICMRSRVKFEIPFPSDSLLTQTALEWLFPSYK